MEVVVVVVLAAVAVEDEYLSEMVVVEAQI
jgi:hypothetical protein